MWRNLRAPGRVISAGTDDRSPSLGEIRTNLLAAVWHLGCNLIGMPYPTAHQLNQITETIIGAAIRVHETLGPGLLESVYLACLTFELAEAGVSVETQRPIPVEYRGVRLECGFRADLIVERAVIVEVKSLERLAPVHQAQMITYLRLTGCLVGLILNFKHAKLEFERIVLSNSR